MQEVLEGHSGLWLRQLEAVGILAATLALVREHSFRRIADNAIKVLGDLAVKKNNTNVPSVSERFAFVFLVERVSNARPLSRFAYISEFLDCFTDGAYKGAEQKLGSVGGVLFHSR